MRHVVFVSILLIGICSLSSPSMAVVAKTNSSASKNKSISKKHEKSTAEAKVIRLDKGKKLAINKKQALKQKRVPAKKEAKVTHRKSKELAHAKKYWSVECRDGFIKNNYVYCARKGVVISKTGRTPNKIRKVASIKSSKQGQVIKR